MCFNLSYQNKMYINKIKGRITKKLDKMNERLIYYVEEFDKMYQEFGDMIIKEYRRMYQPNGYSSPAYQSTEGVMSPYSSSSTISNFEEIDTNNVAITIEEPDINLEQNSNTNFKTNFKTNIKKDTTQELVEKHFVDNTESFLDDAWDIISGSD